MIVQIILALRKMRLLENGSYAEATDGDYPNITVTPGEDDVILISVKNEPGAALPSTGGPGSSVFIGLGVLLVAMAGMVLLGRSHRVYS